MRIGNEGMTSVTRSWRGLQGRVSSNHLCPRNIARLIEQRIHPFKEDRMRQSRMGLESGFVQPARMNEIQPPVSHRSEGVKTHAARLLPRWPCHRAQCLFHSTLFPLSSMQPHEDGLLHGFLPSQSHLPTSLLPVSHGTLLLILGESRREVTIPTRPGQVYRAPAGQRNRRAGLPSGSGWIPPASTPGEPKNRS